MKSKSSPELTPLNFLQTFVVQSTKVGGQFGCLKCNSSLDYIEHLGVAASSCFESVYREQRELKNALNVDQYSDLILNIKNNIGGNFTRASSDPGVVRVISTRCPFGDSVKEAPELCRMTSSVFGSIAARNFGYAKVALNKRLATNDEVCEVCIYTDRDSASAYGGDEYEVEAGAILKKSIAADRSLRIEEGLKKSWCLENEASPESQPKSFVVAESAAMHKVFESIEVVAPTNVRVQITGETGVGKEWIARVTHALSNRSKRPFVVINCGAIPENLIESALFGHEKGAFTDAYNVHHGYFERADKGTLFLDEIDTLPMSAQVRLLRVLQEGEFERVGGQQTLKSDVRIISASNQDIEALVAAGRFRQDLHYRLNVIPIRIPPLRERPEDLTALIKYFLHRLSDRYGCKSKVLSNSAWLIAIAYSWPGNVRELRNILERAFLFSNSDIINELDIANNELPESDILEDTADFNLRKLKKNAISELERKVLHASLDRYSGNVSKVARVIGITPRAVHQKLKFYNIDASVYRKKGETMALDSI